MIKPLPLHEIAPVIESAFSQRKISIGGVRHGSASYDAVLSLASAAYKKPPQELSVESDPYSEIYAAFRDGEVIATVTATRASQGPIETEEVFPKTLLAERRHVIVYAYRLAVAVCDDADQNGLGRLMMRALFADQVLVRGIRLGLITTRTGLAGYYGRAGFLPIKGSAFVHPRLRTSHIPMLYPAHPEHRGLFTDLCDSLSEPLSVAAILNYVDEPDSAGKLRDAPSAHWFGGVA